MNNPEENNVTSKQVPLSNGGTEITGSTGGESIKSQGDVPTQIKNAVLEESKNLTERLTTNFVTILGIFAAFITFLGIDIQILRNVCDYWRILGLGFFTLISVLFFVFALYLFVDHLRPKLSLKVYLLFGLLVIFLGAAFYSLSKAGDEYICKLAQLDSRFEKLETQYSKRNNSFLEELNQRVINLEQRPPSK